MFLKQQISDTEDWNNDAENSALHHWNKLHLKYFNCNNISQYYVFLIK